MNHFANYLSCLQVGIKCHKKEVYFFKTNKFLVNFIKAMYSANLIASYKFLDNQTSLIRFFSTSFLKNIKIISTPGRKVYVNVYKLSSLVYKNKKKVFIISTSLAGIICSSEALKKNVGGKILCEITFK